MSKEGDNDFGLSITHTDFSVYVRDTNFYVYLEGKKEIILLNYLLQIQISVFTLVLAS